MLILSIVVSLVHDHISYAVNLLSCLNICFIIIIIIIIISRLGDGDDIFLSMSTIWRLICRSAMSFFNILYYKSANT